MLNCEKEIIIAQVINRFLWGYLKVWLYAIEKHNFKLGENLYLNFDFINKPNYTESNLLNFLSNFITLI